MRHKRSIPNRGFRVADQIQRDLAELIRSLRPELQDGEFVFCTLPATTVPGDLQPVVTVREAEGLTLVLPAGDERYEGRQVFLDFAAEALHLFDRTSGQRIDVAPWREPAAERVLASA